ncbi:MAG TPA: Vms1/Ankzf1 family peptidyl-tRNA hydrolase [Dehalococcoidia bacterium]|nr:Vms1/Ankzf1 family peptidyl-tRNA hydrolase [Dehalococcoidia bacterium]
MDELAVTRSVEPGQYLGKSALQRHLADLAPGPDAASSSIYLRPDEIESFLGGACRDDLGWASHLTRAGDAVLESANGIIGLRTGNQARIILPPFPLLERLVLPRWETAPLLRLLATEYTIGVVLLRLGRFSVAVYRGEKLVSSKTDARYVKGRHKKGGSSQKRFARIREGQIRLIYDMTCEAVRTQFEPFAGQIDYVVLGGEGLTLNGFLQVCLHMEQFQGRLLGRRLNIRDPKHSTLENVGHLLTQSRVYPVAWQLSPD